MINFILLSDLHLEIKYFFIPETKNEKDTIVVLAGDIGVASKKNTLIDFLVNTSQRFREVIYILGNHEHYRGNFPTSYDKIKTLIKELDINNIHVLEKESIVFDNVAFVCGTLWTDMNKNNPSSMLDAKLCMNDYHVIRTGPKLEPWRQKLEPIDTVAAHLRTKEFIFPEIIKQKENGNKVVVVTHHLPSYQSVPMEFKGDRLSPAYASELFEEIMDTMPDIWCHGHTHTSMDYMIGDCNVLCNPRGYAGTADLNKEFDHLKLINI